MKILIIEDELLAQQKLESMLKALDPSIEILARLSSVKQTVEWLMNNPQPDVAFVDIQLSDNHSFEIFRSINVNFPVIFTTAYDKYLLESFEFNAIDYLLKPFSEEKLKKSLTKLQKLEQHFIHGNLLKLIQKTPSKNVIERIVVKKGTDFIGLKLDEVAYFFTDHRVVFVKDFTGRQFVSDKTLSEIESMIDASTFFRLNRKYISNIKAIQKFRSDNGKIQVYLSPDVKEEIHVSKETAPDFRRWMGVD